ncbi:MAG: PDZ domain-containing protein [Alphaproteobacteria bacterium]|nr:MAG: PDZ domain-containing protein [Alphaproteobacteria bacterium]
MSKKILRGIRTTVRVTIVAFLMAHSEVIAKVPSRGFSKIIAPILPSVVSLSVTMKPEANKDLDGVPTQILEEFARKLPPGFAEDILRRQGRQVPRRTREAGALGSGFVIEYDATKQEAYIVTNDHLVESVKDVKVLLKDEQENATEIKAEIVGRDPRTDIALIKIKTKKPMKPLEWADSEAASVGDWVIAIGNPFGLGNTVTVGVISHKGRSIPHADFVDGFIQTDAAVNVGNSGGALCDIQGKVLGIVVGRIIPGVGDGVSFAIPARVAQETIAQLRKYGRTSRGWIGIGIQAVSDDIVKAMKLKDASGALVGNVTTDGPADKAGVKRGDIILQVNDKPVRDSREVPRIIGNMKIGSNVTLKVLRDGKEIAMKLKLGEYEKAEKEGRLATESEAEKPSKDSAGKHEDLGLTFSDISKENRKIFSIAPTMKGVLVVRVSVDSEAYEKGIRAGDVLESVNMKRVTDLKGLTAVLKSIHDRKESAVLVALNRQGNELPFITLTVDGEEKKD